MYEELVRWQASYLSCHVPRHVFDAPVLGAWVWRLRYDRKRGQLETWKVDLLNQLGFEWSPSQLEARWHAMYHTLRRYKALYGHTNMPRDYRDPRDAQLTALPAWVAKQAKLMAKERLASHKAAMLRALGVTLRVSEERVRAYARLRGLNGHERKLERRRWRAAREAAAAAAAGGGTSGRREPRGRSQVVDGNGAQLSGGALPAGSAAAARLAEEGERRRQLLEAAGPEETLDLFERAGSTRGSGGGGMAAGGSATASQGVPFDSVFRRDDVEKENVATHQHRARLPPILRRHVALKQGT